MVSKNPYIDTKIKTQFREEYNKYIDLLKDYDYNTEFQRHIYMECRIVEMVQYEISRYLLMIGLADGDDISDCEYDMIEELTSCDKIFFGKYNALGKLFEPGSRVKDYLCAPKSIKYLAKIGKKAFHYRLVPSEAYLCIMFCTFFSVFSKLIILADQEVKDTEILAYEKLNSIIRKEVLNYFPDVKFNEGWKVDIGNLQKNHSENTPANEYRQNYDCEEESSYEDLIEELDSLVGLNNIKEDVKTVINLIEIMKARQAHGMKRIPMSLHLVFSGNPGTGKTTVARLLAKLYKEIGVLSKGHLVEVDRAGLVGGYVGQTAAKVKDVVNSALGGILFIDEAYSLTVNKSEGDYGFEAVDSLLKEMEDHRDDLVVIVAGYPEPMEVFLNSNPGLKSRFNKTFMFEDYSPNDMFKIFELLCKSNGYETDNKINNFVKGYFYDLYSSRSDNFANGREVRNFFENAVAAQANRLAKKRHYTGNDLAEFSLADFDFAGEVCADYDYRQESMDNDADKADYKKQVQEAASNSELYTNELIKQAGKAVDFSSLDELSAKLSISHEEVVAAELDALHYATKYMFSHNSFVKDKEKFENLLDLCSYVPDAVINAYEHILTESIKTDKKDTVKVNINECENDFKVTDTSKLSEVIFEAEEGVKGRITGMFKVTRTHLIFTSYEYSSEVKLELLKLKDVRYVYPNKFKYTYVDSNTVYTYDCEQASKLAAYIKVSQKKLTEKKQASDNSVSLPNIGRTNNTENTVVYYNSFNENINKPDENAVLNMYRDKCNYCACFDKTRNICTYKKKCPF